LSFPAGIGAALGELAISVDRAREQAEEHGHSLTEELKILMLHGVLHLLGFDHETDRGTMARAEKRWREQFGLRAGLIERSRSKRTARGT
jgi:probable rRNA maturation factor